MGCTIINGRKKKYKQSLQNTPGPIMLSQIQGKLDLRGLIKYAKAKGVHVTQLTAKETALFMK